MEEVRKGCTFLENSCQWSQTSGPGAALGLPVSKCQENIPEGTDPQFSFLSFIPNISGHWQPQHTLDLHLTVAGVLTMFSFVHFLLIFADIGWDLSCLRLYSFLPWLPARQAQLIRWSWTPNIRSFCWLGRNSTWKVLVQLKNLLPLP